MFGNLPQEVVKRIFDTISDSVIVFDRAHVVLYVNNRLIEEMRKFYGVVMKEGVTLEILFKDQPNELRRIQSNWDRVLSGEAFHYNGTVCKPGDHRSIYYQVSYVPLNDKDGQITGAYAVSRDITDEVESSIQRDLLNNILDNMPLGFAQFDKNGCLVRTNHANQQILGLSNPRYCMGVFNLFTDPCSISCGVSEMGKKACEEQTVVKKEIELEFSAEDHQINTSHRKFIFEIIFFPIVENGETTNLIAVYNDITEKRLQEMELRKTENMLLSAGKMMQLGFWDFDVQTGQLKWSETVREIHDLPPGFVLDLKSAFGFYEEEARERVSQAFSQCLKDGTPYDLEAPIVTARGRRVWIRNVGRAEWLNGKIAKVYGLVRNISERKTRELSILKNQEFLREVGRLAKIGAWEINMQTDEIFISDELRTIYVVGPEVNFKSPKELARFYPQKEDRRRLLLLHERCVQYGTPYELEAIILTGNQHTRRVRILGNAEMANGKTIRVYGAVQDITELYQINEQLLLNKALMDLIFDTIDLGYIALDSSWNCTYVNKRTQEILGEDVTGKNFWKQYQVLNNTVFEASCRQVAETRQSVYIEFMFPPTGAWYEFAIAALQEGGIHMFLRDVSNNKKLRDTLETANVQLQQLNDHLLRQNRQLEEFANITSHNLRSPIANLQLLVQMYEQVQDEREKQTYLDMMKRMIAQVSDILQDLLEVVQTRRDLNLERERLYFEEVLKRTTSLFIMDIEQAQASITTDFSVAFIDYPKIYLESMMQNLLTNALKYRSNERKLSVHFETYWKRDKVVMAVSDNGVGMDMSRIGEKLFGFRKTFHRNKDAKGLGLFITRNQIEAMGGSIRAESIEGVGTTFFITF